MNAIETMLYPLLVDYRKVVSVFFLSELCYAVREQVRIVPK